MSISMSEFKHQKHPTTSHFFTFAATLKFGAIGSINGKPAYFGLFLPNHYSLLSLLIHSSQKSTSNSSFSRLLFFIGFHNILNNQI